MFSCTTFRTFSNTPLVRKALCFTYFPPNYGHLNQSSFNNNLRINTHIIIPTAHHCRRGFPCHPTHVPNHRYQTPSCPWRPRSSSTARDRSNSRPHHRGRARGTRHRGTRGRLGRERRHPITAPVFFKLIRVCTFGHERTPNPGRGVDLGRYHIKQNCMRHFYGFSQSPYERTRLHNNIDN